MAAPAPHSVVFAVHGPIGRDDLPGLCNRICALFQESGPGEAVCDVASVGPDAVTVDALARLQLAAKKYGCRVRMRNASPQLRALVEFMGLSDVLPD